MLILEYGLSMFVILYICVGVGGSERTLGGGGSSCKVGKGTLLAILGILRIFRRYSNSLFSRLVYVIIIIIIDLFS